MLRQIRLKLFKIIIKVLGVVFKLKWNFSYILTITIYQVKVYQEKHWLLELHLCFKLYISMRLLFFPLKKATQDVN